MLHPGVPQYQEPEINSSNVVTGSLVFITFANNVLTTISTAISFHSNFLLFTSHLSSGKWLSCDHGCPLRAQLWRSHRYFHLGSMEDIYVLTHFHAKLMYCWFFRCRNGCQQTPLCPGPRLIWHHYGEVQSHTSSCDLSVSMLWSPSLLWLGTKYMWEEARLVIYRLRSWSVKSSFTSDSSYLNNRSFPILKIILKI